MVSGGNKCLKWLIFVFNFLFFVSDIFYLLLCITICQSKKMGDKALT